MGDNGIPRIETALKWRYAVKAFDPSRKISPDTWAALERAVVLSPSSYGLQPYRLLVIDDPALRLQLLPHAWNQRQVVDASHFVVFTAQTTVTEGHVDRLISRIAEVRGVTTESLAGYREVMIGDLVDGPRRAIARHWATRQTYLALGNLLTVAALLEVDACPMEGFVPDEFDAVLGLQDTGYASVVCCALGYRAVADPYARLAKVRFPGSALIQHR